MSRFVELRIHGVSGTPAAEMLQTDPSHPLTDDDVRRVDQDPVVGFYQRTQTPYGPDHILEAYNWSSLTSGSWVKGLWLLLVPYGLVNAAHFMLPRYRADEPSADESESWTFAQLAHVVAEAALRLIGLVQTLVLTLAAAEALVDLVAWQGTGDRWWLVATVALTGVISILVFLFGARGRTRRPSFAPSSTDNPLSGHTGLAAAEFEMGDPDIPSLTRLHLGAAGAMLGWLCFTAWSGMDDGAVGWIAAHGATACVWAIAVIAAAVLLIGNPHRDRAWWRAVIVRILGWLGLGAGTAGWLIGAYSLSKVDVSRRDRRSSLPGIDTLTRYAMFSGLAAIALLVVSCAAMSFAGRGLAGRGPWRRYLVGFTSPVLASVGTLLGVGFGAAVVLVTRTIVDLMLPKGVAVSLPPLYPRIAGAWALTLGELVLAGLVGAAIWLISRSRFREAVHLAQDVEPLPPATPLTTAAVGRVAFAWWTARVKMHVQWMFCLFAGIGLVLSGLALAAALKTGASGCAGESPALATLGSAVPCGAPAGSWLVVIGTITLIALAVGLAYLGWKSVRNSHWRRSANVVWDIVAFWPRAAHPLVPPPYTAIALDRLRARIYFYLGRCADPKAHPAGACTCPKADQKVDRVVLAAHSQGSLLAVAALAGLRWNTSAIDADDAVRPQELALLTFGSQLQFAYARGFPRYVNVDFLQALLASGGPTGCPWLNLMRETDPVGGQVLSNDRSMSGSAHSHRLTGTGQDVDEPDVEASGGVRICGHEWRLLDPVLGSAATDKPTLLRHSGYFLDPNWTAAVAAVAPLVPSANPIPIQSVPDDSSIIPAG